MATNISVTDDGDGEDTVVSAINTTPLVDIMLVLLIIFLITIPVITKEVPLKLPNETNVPTQTKPENINLAIDKEGHVYWGTTPISDYNVLLQRIEARATDVPQPEVHIRADIDTQYEYVGRVVVVCQRAGISKIGFITQPERGEDAEPTGQP